MPCSCFRGNSEVRPDTEIAIPPSRVIGCYGGVGADSGRASEFLEVEVVPEGVWEENVVESKLGTEEACLVIVVP